MNSRYGSRRYSMEHAKRSFRSRAGAMTLVMFGLMAVFGLAATVNTFAQGAPEPEPAVSAERADVQKFGLMAAALAFGLGAIAAGIAIANVGAAAMGAIGERPEIASQALIFIALAEGLVVFGFITALMILGKV